MQVQQLAVVTHGFVGADLAALCNEAALVCLKRYVKLKKTCSESHPNRSSLAYEDDFINVTDNSRDHLDTTSSSLVDSSASTEIITYSCPREAHSEGDSAKDGVGTNDDEASSVGEFMLRINLEDFEKARMKVRPSAMREV